MPLFKSGENFWSDLRLASFCWLITFAALPGFALAEKTSWIDLYWVGSLLFISAASLWAPGPSGSKLNRKSVLLSLLLLTAGAGVYFYKLQFMQLAFDEDMLTARILRIPSLVEIAFASQQPPLFASLYGSVVRLFGAHILLARLIPALFAALSGPLFFFLAIRIGASSWLGFWASLIFIFDPLLTELGREARPYSLGVFFALVYFSVLSEEEVSQSKARRVLRLMISSFLFLSSIGVQPLFLVMCSAIAYVLIFYKKKRLASLEPITGMALALIVLSPIFYKISGTVNPYLSINLLDPPAAMWEGAQSFIRLASEFSSVGLFASPLILAVLFLWRSEKKSPSMPLLFLLLPVFCFPLFLLLLGELTE